MLNEVLNALSVRKCRENVVFVTLYANIISKVMCNNNNRGENRFWLIENLSHPVTFIVLDYTILSRMVFERRPYRLHDSERLQDSAYC